MDEASNIKLLGTMLSSSSRPKPHLSTYDGSLGANNFMDWFSKLCKYFEYYDIEDDK